MTSARQAAGNEPKEIQTLRLMLRSLSLLQAFETHVYLIDLYYSSLISSLTRILASRNPFFRRRV